MEMEYRPSPGGAIQGVGQGSPTGQGHCQVLNAVLFATIGWRWSGPGDRRRCCGGSQEIPAGKACRNGLGKVIHTRFIGKIRGQPNSLRLGRYTRMNWQDPACQ